jgi:hypothetical protein
MLSILTIKKARTCRITFSPSHSVFLQRFLLPIVDFLLKDTIDFFLLLLLIILDHNSPGILISLGHRVLEVFDGN